MHPQFSDNSKKITTFTVDKSSYQCIWVLVSSNTWKDSRSWWKERKINYASTFPCQLSFELWSGPISIWCFIHAVIIIVIGSLTLLTTTHYLLFITTLYKCLISVCANTHEHTLAAFYDPLFTMIQSSGRQLPKSGSTLHLVPAYKTSSTSTKRN